MGKKSDDDTAVILKSWESSVQAFTPCTTLWWWSLAFGLECDDKDSCRYYRPVLLRRG